MDPETKPGTGLIGSYYYSQTRPKDSGWDDIEYNKRDYDLFSSMLQFDVPKDSVVVAQKRMIELGLLDKGDADTHLGRNTQGAARRYTHNNSGSMIWDYIKDKNPFTD